jgi:tRNA threonylcarbamoyladenosine biosynthesis protein TsaB
VRILGIETSTIRGSVALIEGGRTVLAADHGDPNAHAERVLPLVDRLVAEASWARASFDRVAVGVGPGSFTGLRVGIALAQGIALGIDRPVFGVGSLAAMARAAPVDLRGLRCPVLDARRDELFLAVYDAAGIERNAARAVATSAARRTLNELCASESKILLGQAATAIETDVFRSEHTDLPHAIYVALLSEGLSESAAGAVPLYVRGPGLVLPELPPSPLDESEGSAR